MNWDFFEDITDVPECSKMLSKRDMVLINSAMSFLSCRDNWDTESGWKKALAQISKINANLGNQDC